VLALEFLYLILILWISLIGLHRWILWRQWKLLVDRPAPPVLEAGEATPRVLIQIPVYRDGVVAVRCLASLQDLDWPVTAVQIQLLEDGCDEGDPLLIEAVDGLRARGFDIEHLCRRDRSGFKAGALAAGLRHSDAPLVAIFDADFTVPADFLRRTVKAFDDPRVGMVQTRWGHRNREDSWLTRAQARLLDGHFHIEHRVRAASGRFFNFNGTAGIWRRRAIDDSGGWSGETIIEDMELSLRAWDRGWKFRYIDDVVCPADLPSTFGALRTQQRRWVVGGIQVLNRRLRQESRGSLVDRLDQLVMLGGSMVAPALVGLSLISPWLWWIQSRVGTDPLIQRWGVGSWLDIGFLLLASMSVALFYGGIPTAPLARRGAEVVALMLLGLGLSLHLSRAVWSGWSGRRVSFERTPKDRCSGGARAPTTLERIYGYWLLISALLALSGPGWGAFPLLAMMWGGLIWSLEAGESPEKSDSCPPEVTDELAQLTLDP